MGRKMISVTLPLLGLAQPHQSVLRVSTVRTSGSRLVRRKAPVPLTWRTVWVSSRLRVFCGRAALFRSDQARLIMKIEAILFGRMGSMMRVMTSTVRASTGSTRVMVSTKVPKLLEGAWARAMEKTTSSAVKASPSWKRTPGRSVKRQRMGSSCSQAVARAGSRPRLRERAISGS